MFTRVLWYNLVMKNTTKTITISETEYNNLQTECSSLKQQVDYLMSQLKLSKHRQFGASSEKSEYDGEQLNLFNEAEVEADKTVAEPELVEIEQHYRKRKRLTSDKLPEDLPVEVVEHKLPEDEQDCPECDEKLRVVGRDVRRELVLIPAQAKIREHVEYVYACQPCSKGEEYTPFAKAKMPEPVIKSGFASPEAIAHIMTQKFVMGAPLYRQEQDWNRNGIMLSRQTMSNWLLKATEDWLVPIYERLKQELLCRNVLHADETSLQVLREPGKMARNKSYIWLYRTSGDTENHIIIYEYQPGRHAKYPAKFLETFDGYLHADGYDAYHKLPENITVVGCLAHLRRKFDEALKILPDNARADNPALRGKRYCDKLFKLEQDFATLSAYERFEKRQEVAKPLLDEFYTWAESLNILPKSPMGVAVHYAFSQRKYLERYLLDGRLEISNNRAERSIKPFVIGRKNWIFNNTPRGANASAVMYSIIETAKENGLNPYDYLVHIFKVAPNLTADDLAAAEKLLPWSLELPESVQVRKAAS